MVAKVVHFTSRGERGERREQYNCTCMQLWIWPTLSVPCRPPPFTPFFSEFFSSPFPPPHPTRCCYNCMELNHLPMIIIWAINYFFALLNQFSIFHSFPFPCFVVIKKTLIFYLIQRHEISKFCKRTIKDEPSYHLKKVLDWPIGKWTTGWSEIKIEKFWFLGEAEVPIND